MENIVLAESWGKPNISDRLYYVKATTDLPTLKASGKVLLGDKAFIWTTSQVFFFDGENFVEL